MKADDDVKMIKPEALTMVSKSTELCVHPPASPPPSVARD